MADTERIEAVDAADVAALERAADAAQLPERLKPHGFVDDKIGALCAICDLAIAADVHVEGSSKQDGARSGSAAQDTERGAPTNAGVTPAPSIAPKGALETLVEAAVDAQLGPIAERLAIVASEVRHSMLLLMVLAERNHVDAEELGNAERSRAAVEAQARKQRGGQ